MFRLCTDKRDCFAMFILYCNNNPILWLSLYSFYLCITVRMYSMQRFTVCCSVKIVQCMTICISLWNMLFAKHCASLCECELCRCLLLWCYSCALYDKLYWFIETLSCMRICVWKVTLYTTSPAFVCSSQSEGLPLSSHGKRSDPLYPGHACIQLWGFSSSPVRKCLFWLRDNCYEPVTSLYGT